MGMAERDAGMTDSVGVPSAADRALHEAKRNGRNQVVDLSVA